jgi:hypothetical protein
MTRMNFMRRGDTKESKRNMPFANGYDSYYHPSARMKSARAGFRAEGTIHHS